MNGTEAKEKTRFIVSLMSEARKSRLEAEEKLKEARHTLESAVQNEKEAIEKRREVAASLRAKSERIAILAADMLKNCKEEEQKYLEAEWHYHEDRVKKAVQMWSEQPEIYIYIYITPLLKIWSMFPSLD